LLNQSNLFDASMDTFESGVRPALPSDEVLVVGGAIATSLPVDPNLFRSLSFCVDEIIIC
jgi:hypothetical protein